ncbi:MAG: hypothetical protein ACOYEV_09970, partial [Candidatus Nanopelagicales bacterium]
SKDPATAEARLIDYYKSADRITFPLRRLHRFEAMRPRIDLLQKALTDYEAGRYYSTVLVLLSVMDGFVNDLDTATRQVCMRARWSTWWLGTAWLGITWV